MNNKRDIQVIARYIGLSLLAKGSNVSPLKLQKILYYCQSWYMVFFGRNNTLFEESPEAWANGPVYPIIYQEYRNKVSNMCEHLHLEDFSATENNVSETLKELVDKLNLSKDEVELLDSVIVLYGNKSQNNLIFLTHSEKPWVEARQDLPPYARSNNPISLDTMYQYYKERHDRNRNNQ